MNDVLFYFFVVVDVFLFLKGWEDHRLQEERIKARAVKAFVEGSKMKTMNLAGYIPREVKTSLAVKTSIKDFYHFKIKLSAKIVLGHSVT